MLKNFCIDKIEKSLNCRVLEFKKYLYARESEADKPIILFGAGEGGTYFLELIQQFKKKKILFCDNSISKIGGFIKGVQVISFDELKRIYDNNYIIITSFNYYDEILEQLKKSNIKKNILGGDIYHHLFFKQYDNYFELVNCNIEMFKNAYSILSDDYSKNIFYERINYCITGNRKYLIPFESKHKQYFEPEIIKLSENEIFIDGGAYTGDTVDEFIKQTNGKYKKIYAFEPEVSKHKELLSKNIKWVPYGMWNKKGKLMFNAENSVCSSLDASGNLEVSVISIDEFLKGEKVTFIKMDIEGAEYEALKGAENTIKKYKPKLAICVYHKPLDIVNIPLYLKKIVPDYNIFIRHYFKGPTETVCYAIPSEFGVNR